MPGPDHIKLIVFDVDGVLTDGSIMIDGTGGEYKRFHTRDGFAIRAAMSVGLKIGVISGRASRAVTARMGELGVDLLMQGVKNKSVAFETLCQQAEVLPEDAAYVGDDLIDLPAMLRCGYPMAVGDAPEEVKAAAKYVTTITGGRGAAREAIEHILKAQDQWDDVVDQYGI